MKSASFASVRIISSAVLLLGVWLFPGRVANKYQTASARLGWVRGPDHGVHLQPRPLLPGRHRKEPAQEASA